ncbi:hypothetical protein SPRG_10661 [Saprolegnia parasitica CBS 223.65]|uniref:C2 domain-containing protein n=1 Tax=Saprolegnia parasitica (strain CBS 223.65) TaxID=695850 RepID=A0A067BZJ1_SAPPC|nr:hypothetical protein SPRG_10661 [Saprolegnia parasitica CBS 223.65]KDO23964.1 hypothetical protein SPRG_10661 [Saprolegnia parasitica CBS 223.65]|eukprot:XP_012205285.1 hypothetical protein SPRG_10661 [Saprolegnia parasitica CBS 223.65]
MLGHNIALFDAPKPYGLMCLTVTIKEARQTHATSVYARIKVRDDVQLHTASANNDWNETFHIYVAEPRDETLSVQLIDTSAWFSGDAGACTIPLAGLLSGASVDAWFPLTVRGTQQGEVRLGLQLRGDIATYVKVQRIDVTKAQPLASPVGTTAAAA